MGRKNNAYPQRRPKGEKIQIDIGRQKGYNEYYRKISSGYRTVKFLSIAVLLLYLIVMMCIYRSEITYDNLMYLVKDFNTEASVTFSGFSDISYEKGGNMSFGIFKNRLAVASNSKLVFYNTAGASELESEITMENPEILTSDKYAMVYDIGGNEYMMYTTIAKVLEKKSEYEIQGAALSDSGSFALVTRSRENRYLVDFYNENFKEISKIYKDKYVMDVALDKKGNNYAVVSTDIRDSVFICEVMIGKVGSEEYFSTEIEGEMPMSVYSMDGGVFSVLCDGGVYFFSSSGEKIGEYDMSGMTLQFADSTQKHILIAGNENIVGSAGRLVLLGNDGGELYKSSFDGKINRVGLGENYMFVFSGDSLSRISFDGTAERTDLTGTVNRIMPFGDDALICSPGGAFMGFGRQ